MAAVSTLQIMLDRVLGEPVENIRRRVRGIRYARAVYQGDKA
jgi:hypothetical protein